MSSLNVNPEFNTEMEQLTPETRAHADRFNERYGQLLGNDAFLKGKLEDANTNIERAMAVAQGKSAGYVFNTYSELIAYIAVPENAEKFRLGDQFLIKAKDVPDYWWDNTVTTAQTDSAGNVISGKNTSGKIIGALVELEARKIDLSKYDANDAALFNNMSDQYSSARTYDVGDICIHNNDLYKCVTAVEAAETFNASKWNKTSLAALHAEQEKKISENNQSLNNSKKTYINLALPNVTADAKAVCDYINKNYLLGQLSPAYTVEFDVVASNADWFSGTLSTDLLTLAQGRTVWGFVQQRTSSAENSTLYKYFAKGTGGASSVSAIDETISDPMFCESIPGRNQITNFLYVNLSDRNSDINKIHYFGSNNPATAFTNSPYTASPFFGYRVVRWCSESANTYHLVTVEVHEQYPISGRVWSNTYDINNRKWYGWKCNQGNTFIDVGNVLKGTTTISAGATVTYTATRDCFVNVAAYAHGSGQNTKIYINNVCIFSPYTNNGSDAGLVIVDKTVPLKTGQTIKIENGTYTTSSYAIFAAF